MQFMNINIYLLCIIYIYIIYNMSKEDLTYNIIVIVCVSHSVVSDSL